tara:strand:+ start:320 stop:952 length:633 start_codon:yes stop_codon:yes gene_type:complete
MDFAISYAITVCNEHQEVTELLAFVAQRKRPQDEIVVQFDDLTVTPEVLEVLEAFKAQIATAVGHPLNNDFSSFKNNLKANCNGDYIFQIDADELPAEETVSNLHLILGANPEIDLFLVPRVNTVQNFTKAHVKKWGWRLNEKEWINWPDYQSRICKNLFQIKWQNKVHEQLVGHSTMAQFPAEEKFALLHHKDIKKQEKQNNYYETLTP